MKKYLQKARKFDIKNASSEWITHHNLDWPKDLYQVFETLKSYVNFQPSKGQ